MVHESLIEWVLRTKCCWNHVAWRRQRFLVWSHQHKQPFFFFFGGEGGGFGRTFASYKNRTLSCAWEKSSLNTNNCFCLLSPPFRLYKVRSSINRRDYCKYLNKNKYVNNTILFVSIFTWLHLQILWKTARLDKISVVQHTSAVKNSHVGLLVVRFVAVILMK